MEDMSRKEAVTKIIILAILFMAFMIGLRSEAAEVVLSWNPPTQNEDGTDYTDPDGYKIYESSNDGGPYTQVADITDPALTSHTLTRAAGTYYYVATAYNTSGVESAYSNQAVKTVAPAPPNPPTMLTVQELTAYIVAKTNDRFILLAVGTVASGTQCDPTQTVNGMYAVPKEAVTFTGAEDVIVVADCG